jgi:hypothetical protein
MRLRDVRVGEYPLRDLQRMSGEIASWQAKLPERRRHDVVQALRETLKAAVRWGHMGCNSAKLAGRNPQPQPRPVHALYARRAGRARRPAVSALPGAACVRRRDGLRPEEWEAAERRDVDRRERILNVRRTISSGEGVEHGKTSRSRRQVPLSRRALEALDELTPRLDTPLFPAPADGLIDLHNFRGRAPGRRGRRHHAADQRFRTPTWSGPRRTTPTSAEAFGPLSGHTRGRPCSALPRRNCPFAGKKALKPTEGFEPSTPALRVSPEGGNGGFRRGLGGHQCPANSTVLRSG